VSNLQPADKCKGGNFLPTIGGFGELILKEVDVWLEAISYFILMEKRRLLFFLASWREA